MDPAHKVILDFLSTQPRGLLLDSGAGEGRLTALLRDAGFRVTPCDIDPSAFTPDMACDDVDLNTKTPYKNRQFDYVTSVEVIEHVENPHQLVREYARILAPGGMLIVSTPNIANIYSRLVFLLTGRFFCFGYQERRLGHITPVPWWELQDILARNGFAVVRIATNNYLKITGLGNVRTRIKRIMARAAYLLLFPVITPRDKILLTGDSVIFIARKAKP